MFHVRLRLLLNLHYPEVKSEAHYPAVHIYIADKHNVSDFYMPIHLQFKAYAELRCIQKTIVIVAVRQIGPFIFKVDKGFFI